MKKTIKLTESTLKKMIYEEFREIQKDMFDSTYDGECEKQEAKKIKKAISAKKAAETREKNKRKKNIENLRKFEREHPESFLFDEDRKNGEK